MFLQTLKCRISEKEKRDGLSISQMIFSSAHLREGFQRKPSAVNTIVRIHAHVLCEYSENQDSRGQNLDRLAQIRSSFFDLLVKSDKL